MRKRLPAAMPSPTAPTSRPALGFQRTTVADQAAAALRAAIESGQLADPLPGEIELARRLGVSRPSLHAALAQLARHGLLEIRKGRRTRVVPRPTVRVRAPGKPTIAALAVGPDAQFLAQTPVMLHLRAEAMSRGFEWEHILDRRLASPAGAARLRRLIAGRRETCWVLHSCPARVQRAFAEARVPALVLGSCAPGVALSSVDLDFRSVGWHAAGMLARQGHRRIVLVLPANPLPGDAACREGFVAYFARQNYTGARLTELTLHAPAPRHLARLRAALAGPHPATAVFAMREVNAVAVYTHILALGLAVPGDVSVVSRDTHPLIDAALPHLARYASSPPRQAALALRVAQALLAGRPGPVRARRVTPQFLAGATLGPARAADLPQKPTGSRR